MLCSFEFALRNTLSSKLNFCVQIYFSVLCDSRVQKRNSEFNLSFWPHLRAAYRSGLQAAHVLIRITCKSKKTAFRLGYITKLIVLYQAEQTDDFIRHPVYRTMLTILLNALIIINL